MSAGADTSASPVVRGPLFIIHNPASGTPETGRSRERIAAILEQAGCDHEFLQPDDPRQLGALVHQGVRRARQSRGCVVAAGGDGTLNAVAHALIGTDLAMGVLPLGTFNYFSRAHGIPDDLEAAVGVLLSGCVRPVQVGLVNDQVFLVNASLGLYPELLQDREAAKRRLGRHRLVVFLAAAWTLLRERRRLRLQLVYDGKIERLTTATLFVGNNRMQLERIGIAEAAEIEQTRLLAIALRPVSPACQLWLALRGSLRRLGDAQNLCSFSFREMTVNPSAGRRRRAGPLNIKVAIDGEVLRLRLPLRFAVDRRGLQVICPATGARPAED